MLESFVSEPPAKDSLRCDYHDEQKTDKNNLEAHTKLILQSEVDMLSAFPELFKARECKPPLKEALVRFLTTANSSRMLLFLLLITFALLTVATEASKMIYPLLFAIGFLIYWVDIFLFNDTFSSLRSVRNVENIYEFVNNLKRNGVPYVSLHMECYHTENRLKMISSSDQNGIDKFKTENLEVKEITWAGRESFAYSSWEDISQPFIHNRNFPLGKVQFKKEYVLEDETSQKELERQINSMVENNKHRDRFNRWWVSVEISGFHEAVAFSTSKKWAYFLNWKVYLIFSIFLCETIFSFVLFHNLNLKEFKIVKKIQCN